MAVLSFSGKTRLWREISEVLEMCQHHYVNVMKIVHVACMYC